MATVCKWRQLMVEAGTKTDEDLRPQDVEDPLEEVKTQGQNR